MESLQKTIDYFKYKLINGSLSKSRRKQYEAAVSAMEELKQYREIGTAGACLGYKIHSQNISGLPDCNDCGRSGRCEAEPKPGAYTRINCHLWTAREIKR